MKRIILLKGNGAAPVTVYEGRDDIITSKFYNLWAKWRFVSQKTNRIYALLQDDAFEVERAGRHETWILVTI